MTLRKPTANQVRNLRRKSRLNRRDFGALVGISGRTVESYEQGLRQCPADRFAYWRERVEQQ